MAGDFDPPTPCCQADIDDDGSVGIHLEPIAIGDSFEPGVAHLARAGEAGEAGFHVVIVVVNLDKPIG